MTRWRLDIAYDGANFSGWAAQPGRRTVQGELETWIPRVLRLGEPTPLTVAGRTDAGVHARGQVAHVDLPDDIDTSSMLRRLNTAGDSLLGLYDFAAFCKYREGATTIRTLLDCHAERLEDPCGTIEVTVRADAFCHSMVRSLIGALTAVASGRRDQHWLDEVAASTSRASSVLVMPACGLTLEEVGYPAEEDLAERAAQARSRRSHDELCDTCWED